MQINTQFSLGGPNSSRQNQHMEKNAKEYTSFLMSTFAKTMLETLDKPESLEEDIAGNSFLSEVLGEAMVESGMGEALQKDLLSSMLELASKGKESFHAAS